MNQSSHLSSKHDNDPILDYQNIPYDTLLRKRVYLGAMPFYNLDSQDLTALTLHKIEEIRASKDRTGPQVVYIQDPYRFVWVRLAKKYLPLAKEAFINLASGAGIRWMSRKLARPLDHSVSAINYAMNLMRLAQAKEYTVFIVGSKDEALERLTINLKRSFPDLRIVGKHHGYLKGPLKQRVTEALKKTDPHIILLGLGYHREMRWVAEHKDSLGNALLVNLGGALDVLSGRKRKAPDWVHTKGLTWFWRIVNRPWRWHRMFLIIYWYFQVWYGRFFPDRSKLLKQ